MLIFLDSAKIEEIKEVSLWGIIDGLTTNPTLIEKSGKKFNTEFVKELTQYINGPISVEVIKDDYEGMIEEALSLHTIHDNIVIKIPMTVEGIKAVCYLSDKNIKTNVTLVFSANQALLEAKAGATYVSPFLGRLCDVGENGLILVKDIIQIFSNYNLQTEVIAASIRNPIHFKECAKYGCDIATVPYKILLQLFEHPLTDKGIQLFKDDWKKVSERQN